MYGRMLFFRGFQVQKVNIKINRMELKIIRLVCSMYSLVNPLAHFFDPIMFARNRCL